MKKIVIIFIGVFGLLVTKGQINKKANLSSIDSFKAQFAYHFKILDSASKNNKRDTIYCCRASANFMEYHTEIEAGTMGSYFGRLGFTKEALNIWHNWYDRKYRRRKL